MVLQFIGYRAYGSDIALAITSEEESSAVQNVFSPRLNRADDRGGEHAGLRICPAWSTGLVRTLQAADLPLLSERVNELPT
jgi:hypothetical protein